jgi:tetratricopeptide (TPR) repeat protein
MGAAAIMTITEQADPVSRVGRGRWTPGQLWQVPTFLIGLGAFLAVAASSPIRHPSESRQFDAVVYELRQGLQKNEPPAALVGLADRVLSQVHEFGDRAAEVHFLAGCAYFRQAQGNTPEPARADWQRVVEHLEEALQLGSDERDLPALEYRLGWALYALSRDVPRALELMSRAIDRGAEQPLEGYRLLLRAYLQLPVPDYEAALAASRKVVELTDDRDADALAQGRLNHAELLLRRDQRAEAIRELDRIGPKVSRPLRARARLLEATNCEHEGMWSKALLLWNDLLRDAEQVPGGRARVLYAVGLCSAQLEMPDYPRAVKAWQEALKLGGVEGQAAGLRLGGLRLFGPNADTTQGLDDWRQALAGLVTAASYRNPYLELSEVRALFDQAITLFQETQDYERMQAVAELYRKLVPQGHADEQVARAAEERANQLQRDQHKPAEEVHACHRRAAEWWLVCANTRTDKTNFEALWHSATCFLLGRDADQATKVLLQLEQLDQGDVRLAEGWFRLAELRRELGHKDDAKQAYYRSMQYATTPFAAQARYQLARAAVERMSWDKAAEILEPNLVGPPVDREAHEKSMYEMAWVQLQKPDFGRAAFYLDKATVLYPHNPRALLLRGQLAECYRHFANDAYQKEVKAREDFQGSLTAEQQLQLDEYLLHCRTTRQDWLRKAIDTYQRIADVLREQEGQRALTALEGVLGRRAVLGMAECHHDRGEYLEALRLYQGLMQRNRCKIESLIACERIVQLHNLALKADLLAPEGQTEVVAAARAALHLAGQDLRQMDANGPEFQGNNVWSWQRWQQWIAAEQQRMNGSPLPPLPAKSSMFP